MRTRERVETITFARDAWPGEGSASPAVQQPHSEDGRLAQQAFGAETGFVVQADATSPNESIPTNAAKAIKKMFELGRRVIMARMLPRKIRIISEVRNSPIAPS